MNGKLTAKLCVAAACLAALLLRALPVFASTINVYDQATLNTALGDSDTNITVNVTAPFTMTQIVSIPSGKNVTIRSDPGGAPCTITRDVTGHLFTVEPGGSLTLEDVVIDGNKSSYTYTGSLIQNRGTLHLDAGSVLQNNSNDRGAGVWNTETGTVSMQGGAVRDNEAEELGGGILNEFGTFHFSGGSVTGNTAPEGGGISNLGTLDMTGGVVSGNTARAGAGIENFYGTLNISGGEISGNTATDHYGGGGIVCAGDMTVGGGAVISGNSATGGPGGGISMWDIDHRGSLLTLDGAVITGNYAATDGGGVSAVDSAVEITGSTLISGNSANNGGGVNTDDLTKLTVGPDVVFQDNSAYRAYERDPADNDLYATHIFATRWSDPLTQGYNNYDIGYQSSKPLAIVRYEPNGGSRVPGEALIPGTAAAEPDPPARQGYNFDGWFSDEALTDPYDFESPVNENITLYAKWTRNPVHTVTFDSNGGNAVGEQYVEDGYTAFRPADPHKQGGIFSGWYLDAALTVPYDFSVPVTGDITLYAKWTVPSIPATGDTSGLSLWYAAALPALMGLAFGKPRRNRKDAKPSD